MKSVDFSWWDVENHNKITPAWNLKLKQREREKKYQTDRQNWYKFNQMETKCISDLTEIMYLGTAIYNTLSVSQCKMSRFISINMNVGNARLTYIVKRREWQGWRWWTTNVWSLNSRGAYLWKEKKALVCGCSIIKILSQIGCICASCDICMDVNLDDATPANTDSTVPSMDLLYYWALFVSSTPEYSKFKRCIGHKREGRDLLFSSLI